MRWQIGIVMLGLLAALPAASKDQEPIRVPALERMEDQALTELAGATERAAALPLSPTEAQGVRLAEEWMVKPAILARGGDGRVTFTYGAAMPSIICAPLFVCDLELQPGEVVKDLHIGDGVRWKVQPAISGGVETETTHVIIKPTEPGLMTNMVITTDRRSYSVKLMSREQEWMPRVAFAYPEDARAQWVAYAQSVRQEHQKREEQTLPTGQEIVDLDFAFRISGDSPNWRPVRVYTDGVKTYIEFPKAIQHDEAPALLAMGPGNAEQLVNYRMAENRYIVDKVLTKAALVAGVGKHQRRVRIERQGK